MNSAAESELHDSGRPSQTSSRLCEGGEGSSRGPCSRSLRGGSGTLALGSVRRYRTEVHQDGAETPVNCSTATVAASQHPLLRPALHSPLPHCSRSLAPSPTPHSTPVLSRGGKPCCPPGPALVVMVVGTLHRREDEVVFFLVFFLVALHFRCFGGGGGAGRAFWGVIFVSVFFSFF